MSNEIREITLVILLLVNLLGIPALICLPAFLSKVLESAE